MESLLAELLSINQEILYELKQLRQDLGQNSIQPLPDLPAGPAREQTLDADEPRPRQTRYTPKDLEGIGDAKLTQAPPRYTPKDLEDIRGQLMDGLKKHNRDTGNAFSEFEKRRKAW